MKLFSTSLFLSLLVFGCGSEDPSANAGGTGGGSSTETLLPWATGNRWTYLVTEDGVSTTKETTVGEKEPVGGTGPASAVDAFKVVTKK